MDLIPQPSYPCSIDPLDCNVLFSSILDFTHVMNEDQVVDRLGFVPPTCAIMHDECVHESKEEPMVRMTPFHPCLICSILKSLVLLKLLILPWKNHFRIFILSIIYRTHRMPVYHYIVETTHLPLRICPIYHLSFLKTQRVNILAFHLPLCMIHQIMRISTNITNFLIVVVMIYVLLHLSTMLLHSLLIFLSYQSLMIYLST